MLFSPKREMGALRPCSAAGKKCDFAMSFDGKYRKAIEELQASKIWRANQDQPLNKLYRKIGLNVPPPHYAAFGHVFLAHGVFFLIAWIVLWSLNPFQWPGVSFGFIVGTGLLGGLIYSVIMAAYYRWDRKRHNLTPWDDL